MPELPEVETVKNVLKKDLVNLTITSVLINYKEMIRTDIVSFKNDLIGETILDIKRYGKWLVFETTNYCLLSHLRMEGKYFYTDNKDIEKHVHVVFTFNNNKVLKYKDVRKFGVMYLVKKDRLFIDTPLKTLGIDANSNNLEFSYLKEKLLSKKTPIKTVLLDQEIISGLGNIYVDEVLFKSQISPFKKANLLTDNEIQKIIDNSKLILDDAIKYGGTTIRSYTSSLGVTGSYQDKLLVHTKKICPICSRSIKISKIGGRSTYYCEICQKGEHE